MYPLHPTPAAANAPVLAAYLVRIELSAATYADYERLHAAMAELGFLKFVAADDGRVFHLPSAEYHGLSHLGIEHLRDAVQYVAGLVKPSAQVLVTKAPSMAWSLPVAV